MKNAKVVNLGQVRDLLAEWEKVRSAIVAGSVTGWTATIRHDGRETVFLGGVYQADPELALRAGLMGSMARMLAEDPPLQSKAGT